MRRNALISLFLLTACLGDIDEGAGPRFEVEATDTTTYRYRTTDGRWAFTNSLDEVPGELRSSAEAMDLSGVSLNTELGNELAARLEEEHELRASSDGCVAASDQAEQGTIDRLLTHHRPALGIAAVALLLVFAAPVAARHVGVPQWTRVLGFVLPILGFLGALTFGIVEARQAIARAREGANLCNPEQFAIAPATERIERLRRLDAFLAREGAVHSVTD